MRGDADIPLPEGLAQPPDDADDLREEAEQQIKEPERWPELGLNTLQ